MRNLFLVVAFLFAAPMIAPKEASAKTALQVKHETRAKQYKAQQAAKKEARQANKRR